MIYSFLLNLQDTNRWYRFFRSSYVFIFLFFIYCPWLFIVALSFMQDSQKGNVINSFDGSWAGLTNYEKFFTNSVYYSDFWEGFVNSLLIVSIVTPASLFIGISTAISIWISNEKKKSFIFSLSNLSIGTPDIIQAITFLALFSILFIPMGLMTVVITHIAFTVPYVIIFIYPRLSKISYNTLLASYDLKYTKSETIFKIIIPSLMPSIYLSIFLVFSLSFDDFIITNLVRGNLTTITTTMYTMKRGIKSWAIVFGSLMFWIAITCVVVKCFYESFSSKKVKYK